MEFLGLLSGGFFVWLFMSQEAKSLREANQSIQNRLLMEMYPGLVNIGGGEGDYFIIQPKDDRYVYWFYPTHNAWENGKELLDNYVMAGKRLHSSELPFPSTSA